MTAEGLASVADEDTAGDSSPGSFFSRASILTKLDFFSPFVIKDETDGMGDVIGELLNSDTTCDEGVDDKMGVEASTVSRSQLDDTMLDLAGVDTMAVAVVDGDADVNVAVVTESWPDDSSDNGVDDKMVVEVNDRVFRVDGDVESDLAITDVDSSGVTQSSCDKEGVR